MSVTLLKKAENCLLGKTDKKTETTVHLPLFVFRVNEIILHIAMKIHEKSETWIIQSAPVLDGNNSIEILLKGHHE